IGPIHGGDPELITSKQPDVIFWTYTEAGEADDLQQQTGIPVIVLNYGDLDDNRDTFYDALDLIGIVLDKQERAEEVQGFFDEKIADLQYRTKNIPEEEKPSCYVGGIGYRGPHGIESTEPDYSPFGFVNAKNVAGDIQQEHAMIDIEQVIQWNPEKIFVDAGGYDLMMEDIDNSSALSSLDAVRDDEIYAVLPYNYYTANFGTILINSYFIGKTLYPDSFQDVDIDEMADDIYRFLVGDDVHQDMEEAFVSLGSVETDG
ncbi:MAG: ABC transporter substrate-binding protein, partial [Thermoplasmatota archaeon]